MAAYSKYALAILDDKDKLPEALVTRLKRIFIASFLVSLGAVGVSVKYGTCKRGIPPVSYGIIAGWLSLLKMYELSIIGGGCCAGGCSAIFWVALAMLKSTMEQADMFTDGQAIAQTIE